MPLCAGKGAMAPAAGCLLMKEAADRAQASVCGARRLASSGMGLFFFFFYIFYVRE